jgi:hypothetical protein
MRAAQMLLHIGPTMHSRPAKEIRLAERHTLLPHNVVGGSDVEVEVRDAPVGNVDSSSELELLAGHLDRNLSLLLALESVLVALGLAEELEGTLDAVLELGSVGLVVLVDDPLGASDAVQHTLGDVASELDLEGQRKHVRVQPGAGQLLRRDIVLVGPCFGFLDIVRQLRETAYEERDACNAVVSKRQGIILAAAVSHCAIS